MIKSHLLDGVGRSLIRALGAKAVHTFRDPADAIRSGMHAFGWSFDECLAFVARSFELMDLIAEAKNGFLIFYNDIQRVPVEIVMALADYLRIPIDRQAAALISHDLRAESLKGFTDQLALERQHVEVGRSIVDLGFSYYDLETLLHRRHISSGDYAATVPLNEAQLGEIRRCLSSRIDASGHLEIRRSVLYAAGKKQPLAM